MNAVEERRAAMPNNPYMFNGSRTGPRTVGGKRRQTTRRRRRSGHKRSRSKNMYNKK